MMGPFIRQPGLHFPLQLSRQMRTGHRQCFKYSAAVVERKIASRQTRVNEQRRPTVGQKLLHLVCKPLFDLIPGERCGLRRGLSRNFLPVDAQVFRRFAVFA